MEIKCSQCGFTSNAPDGYLGKKLKCPKCGMEFVACFVILASVLLAGCFPGEAEFVLKASEIRKALSGKPARISATVRTETVLSNAYRKVSFGGGRYTNQLDVIRAMLGNREIMRMFDNNKTDGDMMRMWIEDSDCGLPVFKSEIRVDVLLATEPVLASLKNTTNSLELCALKIDVEKGTIGETGIRESEEFSNLRRSTALAALSGQLITGKVLLPDESEEEMMIVTTTLWHALFPAYFKNWVVEIVGDGEPIHITAEDVEIAGKGFKRYEGLVRKGERLRMRVDKEKHGNDGGGVRFFLDKPDA